MNKLTKEQHAAPENRLRQHMIILASAVLMASLALSTTAVVAGEQQQEETMFERLGGAYGIAQIVDHLVDKIYANEGLNANPILANIHADKSTKPGFKVMLTNWVVERTGGPAIYKQDSFGRGKPLKEGHVHLNISDREFDIIMNECKNSFYAFNVPDEDIELLMADLESFRDDIVTRAD